MIKPWWQRGRTWLQLIMCLWALLVTGWVWAQVTQSVFEYRQKMYERSFFEQSRLVDHVPDQPNDSYSILDIILKRHLDSFQIKNWMQDNGVAFFREYPVYFYLNYETFDHQSMKLQTQPAMVILVSSSRMTTLDHQWTEVKTRRAVINHRIFELAEIHKEDNPKVDSFMYRDLLILGEQQGMPIQLIHYDHPLPKAEEVWVNLHDDFIRYLGDGFRLRVKKVKLQLSEVTKALFISNPDHADVIELELNMHEGETIHPELKIYFDHKQDEAPEFKVNRKGLKIFEISQDFKVIPMNLKE